MNATLQFIAENWLSILLFIGIIVSVWFVYKNRDKLMRKPF